MSLKPQTRCSPDGCNEIKQFLTTALGQMRSIITVEEGQSRPQAFCSCRGEDPGQSWSRVTRILRDKFEIYRGRVGKERTSHN